MLDKFKAFNSLDINSYFASGWIYNTRMVCYKLCCCSYWRDEDFFFLFTFAFWFLIFNDILSKIFLKSKNYYLNIICNLFNLII